VGHQFKVGDTVIHTEGEWYRKEVKIARVFANGNFTLEGDAKQGQWKPAPYSDYASPTGKKHGYTHGTVYAKTPERDAAHAEELARKNRESRWRTAAKYIGEQRGRWLDEEHVAGLEAIAATIKAKYERDRNT